MQDKRTDELRSVAKPDEVGPPSVSLTGTPIWLTLRGKPGRRYRIAFDTRFLPKPRHTSAVILVRIPGDDSTSRNAWGLYEPAFGRFRYLPHPKEPGLAGFTLRWPAQPEVRFGFQSNNHRGDAAISAEILFAEEATGVSDRIYMTEAESILFRSYLARARIYLEFGCGGSTIAAAGTRIERIVSVEADRTWIERLKNHATIAEAERIGRLRLFHADLGPVGPWSIPVSREPSPGWSDYFLGPWRLLAAPPDLVLVDGRFRAACALTALLACPADTTILIHDFVPGDAKRHSYFKVLDVADRIDGTGHLVVLRRKAPFDALRAVTLLSEVRHDVN